MCIYIISGVYMDPISGNRFCYGHHFFSGMDWGCSSTNFNGRYMGMSYSNFCA